MVSEDLERQLTDAPLNHQVSIDVQNLDQAEENKDGSEASPVKAEEDENQSENPGE